MTETRSSRLGTVMINHGHGEQDSEKCQRKKLNRQGNFQHEPRGGSGGYRVSGCGCYCAGHPL